MTGGNRGWRRGALWLAVVALVVVTGACRASARVVVAMRRDGSGTVSVTLRLDAEAAARVGDLPAALSTGDLAAVGWKVGTPTKQGDDTTITVSKPFGSAAGLAGLMREISGASKLLSDWRGSVSDGFGSTTWSVVGRISSTGDLAQFSDERLAAALDGHPLGRTDAELAKEWGGDRPSLPVTFEVRLPDGEVQLTTVDLAGGSRQRRVVAVTSTDRAVGPVAWLLAAGLVAALGAMVLVAARLRRARPRPRSTAR